MKKSFLLKIAVLLSLLISSFYYSYAQTLPPYVPSNGLVGYWSFNGNTNDISGNGNNGINSGAILTTDRFGNVNAAYTFNGSSNYMTIPHKNTLNAFPITINSWIKTSHAFGPIITKYTSGTSNGWSLHVNNDRLSTYYYSNSIGAYIYGDGWTNQGGGYTSSGVWTNSIIVDNNVWHMVTSVYDINGLKLYCDNVLILTSAFINGIPSATTTTQNVYVGNDMINGYPYIFNGKIDDIGIWNRALTQQEISLLYTCIPPSTASAITGLSTVCQNQNSVIYSVPVIANATSYIWSLPTGAAGTSITNSITLNYGTSATSGNIIVKGNNTCGDGISSSKSITVNPLPVLSGNITGSTTICTNQNNIIYTVPAITNATSYIWTLPSGATGSSNTNSITVNYSTNAASGNITVKGVNSCGESNISSLFVNVSPLPVSGLPSTIQACSTASLTANPGYTYLWSTAATTQSITVNQSGWYKCTVSNGSCSVTDSTNVTINNQYNYNCELRNDEQTSPNTYEFDIYVLNANDCVPLVYASGAYGITLNPAITNGGSISVSIVPGSSQLNASQQPTSISFTASQNAIKILPKAAPAVASSTIIPFNSPGVKVCRVKITNSQPFAASSANLNWSFTSTPYQSKINAYINNVNTLLTANTTSHTTHHLLNPVFTGIISPASATVDRNNLCAADTDSIILTATGGSGNTLKWYKDSCGGVSFASGTITTIPSPDTTTTYYARWEMSALFTTCASVTIIVIPSIIVSASIVENTNHFCRGTSVTLTATLQNEGSTPLIQWYKNNQILTGENELLYTYSAFNNDSIYCILTSSLNGCLSNQTVKSNTIAIMVDNPPKYSHIKLYLEGLYNISEQNMSAVMNDASYQFGNNIADHITLILANPYFPYAVTDTFNLALQTNGILIFDVPCWINGYHYLKIKSRNHLETWSMHAISFDSDSTYYDFSTSADKVAGENQKQVSPGIYALLIGDVNQDGVVDISDLVDMDSDITNGSLGYIVYDLNGDGVIDISDLVKIDENITTGAVVYEPYVTLACANTTNVSDITTSTATVGGNISCDGSAIVTERGICFSTSPNPTTANTKVISGNGLGSFTANLTGLTSNTTYYVKTYATNAAGTAYGIEVSFSTTPIFKVYDIDGNGYDTVQKGTQVWLKQNLKTTKYKNGDAIPNVIDNATWSNLTTGARCYYNNDSATYASTYGALYNWYTVNTGNLCPTSWHVPSDAEWTILENYLGGNNIAGGKLKEVGTVHWNSPNINATNESGFTALPAGDRWNDGSYHVLYFQTYFWSSSFDGSEAYYRGYYNDNTIITDFNTLINTGFSIRCIKDIQTIIYPQIFDIDGNGYDTVQIGTQIWMKQNLKTTKYRNGNAIPNITDGTAWSNLTTGAYCNYNNDTNIANTYGRLYNWYTVNDSRNLCPTGWHVPTDAEWTSLTTYLGGSTIAGGKLKEVGLAHWNNPNTGATNEFGFTALPSGRRYNTDGSYDTIGIMGNWWSSSEGNITSEAWYRILFYNSIDISKYNNYKWVGNSVRCLKN